MGIIVDMFVCLYLYYDFLFFYNMIFKEWQDIWYIYGVYIYVCLMFGKILGEIEQVFCDIFDKYKIDVLKYKIWVVELILLKDIYFIL